MALKSFIISKLDHQMSKSWKRIVAHTFETTNKFENCQTEYLTSSPVGKIQILFLFLPLPRELVWLKINHLTTRTVFKTRRNKKWILHIIV